VFRRTNSEPHKCVYCNQIDINMERFVWAELADIHLANGAAYGNGRQAQRIYHRVRPIVVRSLLSTFAYGKLVLHLQLTGTAQGEEDQFVRLNLMKFYSVLRRNPPQAPVRLFTQSECVVVLCGTLYANRSSILSIGKRCRLYWAPTITFVETNLFVGLFISIQRSPTFLQWYACFIRERIFNSHNSHAWAEANPHAASAHCHHQQRFVVNVWAGIITNFLIGPCYPDGSVRIFTVCFWKKSYQKCWKKSRC